MYIGVWNQQQFYKQIRELGRIWWWGDIPIKHSRRFLRLHDLLSMPIAARFATAEQSGLAVLALKTFFEEFQQLSQIACTFELSGTQVCLEIQVCPFCLGEDLPCLIFLGVLEGFIEWLRKNPFTFQETFQINLQQSTFHRIVFDIV